VHDSRAARQALAILAGTTLLRLVVGAIVPLFPDETYYWDWSRTLASGYFDHPPIIALLIRAGTAIFGDTALGVRFFPILAGTGAALGLMQSARVMAGDDAANLATRVFVCLPLATVGLVLATPDAPMLCAAAWTMYAVIRALRPGDIPRSLDWWVLAGICAGLAMASKYTAVLLPAALALAFVSHPRLQNKFGEPGPWLAVLVASLVMAPVLWWNAAHDWVSFRFQLGHGFGDPKGGALGLVNRELELIAGQIGLVSPILIYFLVRAIKRSMDPTPDGVRLALGVVSACCLVFFLFSATRRSVEPNIAPTDPINDVPNTFRSAVLKGMKITSSWSDPCADWPLGARTPMTRNGTFLMRITAPTGSSPGSNRFPTIVWPMSATRAALSKSV